MRWNETHRAMAAALVRPARRQAAKAAVIFMVNRVIGLDRSFELGKMEVDEGFVFVGACECWM